jgi:ectoine hydroxylase-related dioxygenase (phytanoyl-CoA dioxygenase family)
MPLSYLDHTATPETAAQIMSRDGAVVVTGLVEPGRVDAIAGELRAELDARGLAETTLFGGDRTRRIRNVLSVAPSAAALLDHDMVIGITNEALLPFCANYQIGSTEAVEVLPGQPSQPLHRDDTIYPLEMAGLEFQIGVMWALDDFTQENGGTRVVTGSHRTLRSWHLPKLAAWEATEMPRGSALFYTGSVWHGAGENCSRTPRLGLVTTYALGWLRQEHNQYLYTPPEVAVRFAPRLRALLGYTPHGSGNDLAGRYTGDCPAWVATPPEPAWQADRGQTATQADVEAQAPD